MIKEKINMELRARILVIISISSLILYLSVEGLNILPSITQPSFKLDKVNQLEKDQKDHGSPDLEEIKVASGPSTGPVSPTALDQVDSFKPEAPKSSSEISSPGPSEGKETRKRTSLWGEMSTIIDEAEKTIAPITSSIVTEVEYVSSSILGLDAKASSPFSPGSSPSQGPAHGLVTDPVDGPGLAPGLGPGPVHGPGLAPNLGPSPMEGPRLVPGQSPVHSPSSVPGPVPVPAEGPVNGMGSVPSPGPAPTGFIDHDVALAIGARIKQSQSDSQLAMDEAKKLLTDPNIASSETGKCLSKCIDKYGASLNELNRAITDLGVRDVTLLADDFGKVETDISTCQACFTENIGEDSPLKPLEEATTKAARECLTVMDYAA